MDPPGVSITVNQENVPLRSAGPHHISRRRLMGAEKDKLRIVEIPEEDRREIRAILEAQSPINLSPTLRQGQ
jgi:hypothetical protein